MESSSKENSGMQRMHHSNPHIREGSPRYPSPWVLMITIPARQCLVLARFVFWSEILLVPAI